VYIHIYVYIYTYIYIYTYMYVCMYVCIRICICIYVCMHICCRLSKGCKWVAWVAWVAVAWWVVCVCVYIHTYQDASELAGVREVFLNQWDFVVLGFFFWCSIFPIFSWWYCWAGGVEPVWGFFWGFLLLLTFAHERMCSVLTCWTRRPFFWVSQNPKLCVAVIKW